MFIAEPAHPFKNPLLGFFCVYCVILLTLLPKNNLIRVETQYLNNKSFTLIL